MKIRETQCISDVFTTVLQSLVCMSHDCIDASFRHAACNSHRFDTSLRPVASNTVTVTRLTPVSDLWHLTVTGVTPVSDLWHLNSHLVDASLRPVASNSHWGDTCLRPVASNSCWFDTSLRPVASNSH